jgi:hypothetical protein
LEVFILNRKNKRFSALSLILALVLITGAVYAAGTGVLTFTGTADLGVLDLDLELEITASSLDGVSTDADGSSGSMVVAGELATFTVDLAEPGSEVVFTFNVENVGSLDALLTMFTINSDSHGADLDDILEFTGSFETDLEFESIAVGDSIDDVTLGIKWKDTATAFAEESVEFTLTIAYMQDI